MRVLVTGGTGFIGSHLVAALRNRGDGVVCLVRKKIRWNDDGIECVSVDLEDMTALHECLVQIKPCDAIVHFGAKLPIPSATKPEALRPYVDANVGATCRLLESAVAWAVQSFVFASSITVVERPIAGAINEDRRICPDHAYSTSKSQAELACEYCRRKAGVQAYSLRITSPYGPGMSPTTVLPRFVNLARESKDILLLGSGARTQNFVHVSDVVRAVLLALDATKPGVYNVAGAVAASMLDLASLAIQAVPGCTSRVRLAGKPDPQEDFRWNVDASKAERELGFKASVGLAEGISAYVEGLKRGDFHSWWTPCD